MRRDGGGALFPTWQLKSTISGYPSTTPYAIDLPILFNSRKKRFHSTGFLRKIKFLAWRGRLPS